MKKNMSSFDRIFRVILALVLGYLYWKGMLTGVWGIVVLVLAVVLLLTALINFCPLYALFGMHTNKKKTTAA